jgi:hypothetical protein
LDHRTFRCAKDDLGAIRRAAGGDHVAVRSDRPGNEARHQPQPNRWWPWTEEVGMATPAPQPRGVRDRAASRNNGRSNVRPINFLLLVPVVGALLPMLYNFDAPRLGGIPFFYWYQFLWIAVSVLVTTIVYRATRGER